VRPQRESEGTSKEVNGNRSRKEEGQGPWGKTKLSTSDLALKIRGKQSPSAPRQPLEKTSKRNAIEKRGEEALNQMMKLRRGVF